MKQTFSFLFIIIFLTTFIKAQDCSDYFAFKDGIQLEITNYTAKDKVEGKSIMKVKSAQASEATMSMTYYDKKDKIVFENFDVNLTCEARAVSIDRASFMNAFTSMTGVEGVEIDVDGEFLEFPADMKVGDKLKDAVSSVTTNISGISMTNDTKFINRKVRSKESITVPAGTFECYKISYDVSTKNTLMTMTMSFEEWYAPQVGLPVKTIIYKKNGKLDSYSLLTKLTGI